MKAIRITQHDDISQLKVSDVPRPSLGAGEVLVQVGAAGINPSDVGSFTGRFPESVLPRIVGRDFAGKVVEGPTEIIGTEVWGTGGDLGISRDGTHAEYLVIPQSAVVRRPSSLSLEEAAIAGVPFVTAFSALVTLGQIKEGEWVIVSGAAGAVGKAAIQIARAKGAHILALVRDESDRGAFQTGEVDAISQSNKSDLEAVGREVTNGKGVDLALNGVGSTIFASLLGSLAVGGRLVVYSSAAGREFPLDILSFYRRQVTLFGLNTQLLDVVQCAAILKQIAPLFDLGAISAPKAGSRHPLSQAVDAYASVASGKGGKIVLIMS